MLCPACGTENTFPGAVCRRCGAELPVPVRDAGGLSLDRAASALGIRVGAGQGAELQGIWGWLLLYCAGLVAINPFLVFTSAMHGSLLVALLERLLVVYGVVVGIMLWSRGPKALGLLQIYLFSSFFIKAMGIVIVVLDLAVGRAADRGDLAAELAGRLLGLAILIVWVWYFQVSRRVKATYGSNLFG